MLCFVSDNKVDDEAFHLLDKDTIKDLIPAVGTRVNFEKAFKAFRQVDQPIAEAAREMPDRHTAPEGLQEIEEDEVRNKQNLSCSKCFEQHRQVSEKETVDTGP